MSTIDPISKKPFITLENELVTLAFPRKKYAFSISDIQKIYIGRRRPNYIAAIVGHLLDIRDTRYILHVKNNDSDTRIPITRIQRYYCIKLIALLRQSKSEVPDFV